MSQRRLRLGSPGVALAGAVCALFVAVALLAPWIAPHDPLAGCSMNG